MFVLIRHAGYSLTDGSLTTDGAEATHRLAARLHATGNAWKIIQTSPARRTQETATIISQELGVPISPDTRISTKGNCVDFFPPHEPQDTILISHLPVITKLLRRWSNAFGEDEPPFTEMGHGYVIDPEQQTILPLEAGV